MVLLHAGIADHTMWHDQLEPLAAAGFHALALDLPGFGDATVGSGPQAPWEDVLRVLRELELGRAVLVGNSFGAAVALRVAAVAPSACSALVLVSAPPLSGEPSSQLEEAWAAENAALEREDIEAAVQAVVDAWTQADAPLELRARVASMQRRAFELQATAPDVREAPDPLEANPSVLAELELPVLLMAGESDMPDFKRAVRELEAALPRARGVLLEGAGHLAPLERPEAFRSLLLEFLGEHGLVPGTAAPGGPAAGRRN